MALAANCNIIVALNKVDRIPKGPERTSARARVLAQLIQLGLVPEEYGGNCCALMGRLYCILDGIKMCGLLVCDDIVDPCLHTAFFTVI
jgi:hypothetical protein